MARSAPKAVEMVRKIRDEHAAALEGKSPDEVLAFYRKAGDAARRGAKRRAAARTRSEAPSRRSRR